MSLISVVQVRMACKQDPPKVRYSSSALVHRERTAKFENRMIQVRCLVGQAGYFWASKIYKETISCQLQAISLILSIIAVSHRHSKQSRLFSREDFQSANMHFTSFAAFLAFAIVGVTAAPGYSPPPPVYAPPPPPSPPVYAKPPPPAPPAYVAPVAPPRPSRPAAPAPPTFNQQSVRSPHSSSSHVCH